MKQVRRSGSVLIVAIFVLSIACIYITEQAQLMLLHHKLQRRQLRDYQMQQIQHAARERISLQLRLNAEYQGELWLPPVATEHEEDCWEVRIQRLDPTNNDLDRWNIEPLLVTRPANNPLDVAGE